MAASAIDPLFEEILKEAQSEFQIGNYKVAEPLLQQLILKNARHPEAYQMLATIYYDKGQFTKAIRTFKRALEIDPTYTDASIGLSIILNDLGRYEEGKRVFEDAKALLDRQGSEVDTYLDEKIASKHEEIADLYYQSGRYHESLEQLLKAKALSTRKAEITMRTADCFVKLNESDRAIADLRSLIREYPQFLPARLKLGQIFYNLNNLAEATEQWENILARDPYHSEAQKFLRMAQTAGITTLPTESL